MSVVAFVFLMDQLYASLLVLLLHRVIDEMIERVPGCVHFHGFQQETPLHDACSTGYVKVAKRLLEMGADVGAM